MLLKFIKKFIDIQHIYDLVEKEVREKYNTNLRKLQWDYIAESIKKNKEIAELKKQIKELKDKIENEHLKGGLSINE